MRSFNIDVPHVAAFSRLPPKVTSFGRGRRCPKSLPPRRRGRMRAAAAKADTLAAQLKTKPPIRQTPSQYPANPAI
ncbi:hypothetical protein [Lysobacter gummosus]|uniref:hypothetical protein n=1 Tax=Lysobacter gummosus TaxID=262324 RepID=UPI00363453F2